MGRRKSENTIDTERRLKVYAERDQMRSMATTFVDSGKKPILLVDEYPIKNNGLVEWLNNQGYYVSQTDSTSAPIFLANDAHHVTDDNCVNQTPDYGLVIVDFLVCSKKLEEMFYAIKAGEIGVDRTIVALTRNTLTRRLIVESGCEYFMKPSYAAYDFQSLQAIVEANCNIHQ